MVKEVLEINSLSVASECVCVCVYIILFIKGRIYTRFLV